MIPIRLSIGKDKDPLKKLIKWTSDYWCYKDNLLYTLDASNTRFYLKGILSPIRAGVTSNIKEAMEIEFYSTKQTKLKKIKYEGGDLDDVAIGGKLIIMDDITMTVFLGPSGILSTSNLLSSSVKKWSIETVKPVKTGVYLLTIDGLAYSGLGTLQKYDVKNLDMNVQWKYYKNKLRTYKNPKLSFTQVVMSRGNPLQLLTYQCDTDIDCIVQPTDSNIKKFILTPNKLIDTVTGYCYYLKNSKLISPNSSNAVIKVIPLFEKERKIADTINDSKPVYGRTTCEYALTGSNSFCNKTSSPDDCSKNKLKCCMGDSSIYYKSNGKKYISSRKCVKDWCPWSNECIKSEMPLEYCSSLDKYGEPNLFTDDNCKRWCSENQGPCDLAADKFCEKYPKHPSCSCTLFQKTKYGKELIKNVSSNLVGSLACVMPQCTLPSYQTLKGKKIKETTLGKGCSNDINISICNSLINTKSGGSTSIDHNTIVQACGQNIQACSTNSDCKLGEVCDRGYCFPGKTCKYKTDWVYSKCVNGKRTKTQKVESGPSTCKDIAVTESCAMCKKNKDCKSGKTCKNGSCVKECNYGDWQYGDCIKTKQVRTRIDKNGVCENIIIEQDCPCAIDSDCGKGQICEEGKCVKACSIDSDCKDGVCKNGRCIDKEQNNKENLKKMLVYGGVGLGGLIVVFILIKTLASNKNK